LFSNCFASIDGTLCPIERPTDEQLQQHVISGRHHRFGYLYLIVTRNTDGRIVAVYGPHSSAGNDLNVLYDCNLLQHRQKDEWFIGDGLFNSELL
jgi:hypothetical protein